MKTDHCTQQHGERCGSRNEWWFKSAKLKRRNGAAPLPSVPGAGLPGGSKQETAGEGFMLQAGCSVCFLSLQRKEMTTHLNANSKTAEGDLLQQE